MYVTPFSLSRLPQILFGPGRLAEAASVIARFGSKALVLTGEASFVRSARWPALQGALETHGVQVFHGTVACEPSPELVDNLVARFRPQSINVVVGIGGGSTLDAAKAVAGLLPFGNSVLDHLEGVGRGIPYNGPALPFVALPTTAGTGSEATKNAVLSVHGEEGYKKSFRHDTLVPTYAIVDPDLLDTCSPRLIAANGMDALTQLLESYVSLRANPFTDALALSGLAAVERGLMAAWRGGLSREARAGRSDMAYAALLSGITLAQAGLGSVHGLASPLGCFFPIPHGVACGTTVAAATAMNIRVLRQRQAESSALEKYAAVGRVVSRNPTLSDVDAQDALVAQLAAWTRQTAIPSLREYGVSEKDIPRIVANSRGNSMQTNPIRLADGEIGDILLQCI